MVWTLCGQNTLLLPVQLELGRISQSLIVPAREQHISFNAMQQPDTISEGGYTATFSYYGDMGRASMAVTDSLGHMVETRTYYDQRYNEFTRINGNTTQTKRILWSFMTFVGFGALGLLKSIIAVQFPFSFLQ